MIIKHLQLNTSLLRNPEAVAKFIQERNIDVGCLQEIVYPMGGVSPLNELVEKMGYHYTEGIHFHLPHKNQSVGAAIISRFPVLDYSLVYFNTPDYLPKKIGENDLLGEVLEDIQADNPPGSRGLKHVVKSRCILSCLVKVEDKAIRLITTHFTVSDLCTETPQMYEMSQMVYSLVKNSKDLPTIFSADLNIRPQSYSVMLLSKAITCHTSEFTDTLSPTHVAKKKDFPQGLAIDHVFSKGFGYKGTNLIDVDFSEHKALVSEFEL